MRDFKSILIFGGLGFIGSEYILKARERFPDAKIINFDSQNYATSLHTKELLDTIENYIYIKSDIRYKDQVISALKEFSPDLIVNFAAESHVDNSIESAEVFIDTNIKGTFNILEATRLIQDDGENCILHHVSTDEVFGDLDLEGTAKFSETTPYDPSSPYSASKAASDHLVRAWARTYKINYLITNCSNNFGPRQYTEKLIPKAINLLLDNKKVPIYGNGKNIRDWIYVGEHVDRLIDLQMSSAKNDTYLIGGNNELSNVEIIKEIVSIIHPSGQWNPGEYIAFVDDRKGHDMRYAIDDTKMRNFLGKVDKESFSDQLQSTVTWYQKNLDWWE